MESKEKEKSDIIKLYKDDSIVECAKESAKFFISRGYSEKTSKQPDKKSE